MRKLLRSATRLPLLLIILSLTQDPVAAQEQKPVKMKPMGKEAYQVLTQFFQYDRGIPLNVRIVQTRDDPEYTREKIVFTGVRDSRVPGYLAIPKTGSPPYPCVLLMHGGVSAGKASWWERSAWLGGGTYLDGWVTQGLLAAGYAVLALDAQYYGERVMNNDYRGFTGDILRKKWGSRGREAIVQSVVEYRRALDYLATRPDIDTTRIGATGYSLGGLMTFLLTAVEPRIKVAVPCVTPQKFFDMPGIEVLAPWHYAGAVGDRPFLMLMGRSDPNNYLVEDAQRLYEFIKGSQKELLFYESGHSLPMEHVPDSIEWFKKHL